MIVIKPGGCFMTNGAVVLTPQEIAVAHHAISDTLAKVVPGQTNYGPMTISEVKTFEDELRELTNK
jgi:hypothetical protein